MDTLSKEKAGDCDNNMTSGVHSALEKMKYDSGRLATRRLEESRKQCRLVDKHNKVAFGTRRRIIIRRKRWVDRRTALLLAMASDRPNDRRDQPSLEGER